MKRPLRGDRHALKAMLLLFGAAALPATAQNSTSFTIPADAEITEQAVSSWANGHYRFSYNCKSTSFVYDQACISVDLYPSTSGLKDDFAKQNGYESYSKLDELVSKEDLDAISLKSVIDSTYERALAELNVLSTRVRLDLENGGAYIKNISIADGCAGTACLSLPEKLYLDETTNYTLAGLGWDETENLYDDSRGGCDINYLGYINLSSSITYLNIYRGGVQNDYTNEREDIDLIIFNSTSLPTVTTQVCNR